MSVCPPSAAPWISWRTTCFPEVPPFLGLRDANSKGPGVPDEDPVIASPTLSHPFSVPLSSDARQAEVNGLHRFPCCTNEEAERQSWE